MDKVKKILRKFADLLNEHWIWKTIILFLPSIYMPLIVKYTGVKLGLTNKNSELTTVGIVITVLIYASVLAVNILSSYKGKRDKELEEEKEALHRKEIEKYKNELYNYYNTMDVYDKLMTVIGNICDVKLEAIFNYINLALENGVVRQIKIIFHRQIILSCFKDFA